MIHYLNVKSGTLHIEGYCRFADPAPKEYLKFNSEEEAYSYGGLSVGLCKFCQKKRQAVMEKNK